MSTYHDLGRQLQQSNDKELSKSLLDRPLTIDSLWHHLTTLPKLRHVSEDIRKRFELLSKENRDFIIKNLVMMLNGEIQSLELIGAFIDLKITQDIDLPIWTLAMSNVEYLYKMGYRQKIHELLVSSIENMTVSKFITILSDKESNLLLHLPDLCKCINLEKFIAIKPEMYEHSGKTKICELFMLIEDDDIVIQLLHDYANSNELVNINNCIAVLLTHEFSRKRLQNFVNTCLNKRTPLCLAIRKNNMIAIETLIFRLNADINLVDESKKNPYYTLHHSRSSQEFITHVEKMFSKAPQINSNIDSHASYVNFTKIQSSSYTAVPHEQPQSDGANSIQSTLALFNDEDIQETCRSEHKMIPENQSIITKHLIKTIRKIIDSSNIESFKKLIKCPVISEIIPEIKFIVDGTLTSIKLYIRLMIVHKYGHSNNSKILNITNEMTALEEMLLDIA